MRGWSGYLKVLIISVVLMDMGLILYVVEERFGFDGVEWYDHKVIDGKMDVMVKMVIVVEKNVGNCLVVVGVDG